MRYPTGPSSEFDPKGLFRRSSAPEKPPDNGHFLFQGKDLGHTHQTRSLK